MTTRPVITLGDANVDLVIRLPDRGAGRADLTGSTPRLFGGGSVANVAVALARLGAPVSFVGVVGDDGYGRFVQADLAAEGVDTSGLCVSRDALTPMVIALIEPSGERMNVVWPPERGADKLLAPEQVDPDAIASAAWLHTSGMVLRDSPVREAALYAMRLAHDAGVPVSLDLNLRLELWGWDDAIADTMVEAVGLADVALGSAKEEIAPLAGTDRIEDAARALSGGRRVVVARLGEQGALVCDPAGNLMHVPAFPTTVVDTLGAGDAFDGGFIAARLAGCDWVEATRWGNAVAALKIARPGARGTPTRAEVLWLLGGQPASS